MSKEKKVAQPGDHIALHQLHLGDTDGLGPTVIGVGEPVPEGTFTDAELARLVAKKAIQAPPGSASKVKAEGASRDDLDKITGTDGDDGLGDDDEAGGDDGKGEAATSVPTTKPSGTKAVKKAAGKTR